MSFPVLRLYNLHLSCELHTDASTIAVAGTKAFCLHKFALLKKQVLGQWAPIAYFSQSTNKAESRYHSFELEMLAIIKSIERFHIYLYGIDFTVVTDCRALVFAINKANINPRIARWTLKLQNYRFTVVYREGRRMSHVDVLSRIVVLVDSFPLEKELQFKQLQDPKLKINAESLESKENEKFELIDGLVFKKYLERSLFVVPDSIISNVIRIYHDMSHCGIDKTIKGILFNYWFPSTQKDPGSY